MKPYTVYFAGPLFPENGNSFDFKYDVHASNEEDAKRKAITLFSQANPTLKLDDYVVGFEKTSGN